MDITIFKDIKDTAQPFYRKVEVILKRNQEGSSKELIKKIRATKDKEKRNVQQEKKLDLDNVE